MDAVLRADEDVLLWLNQWAGHLPALDAVMKVFISDYFATSLLSLCLLAMWFGLGAKNIVERDRNQRAVAVAMIALGFANLAVFVINHHYVRLRPFVSYDEVTLLFYEPTDISSFPANPAAVAAAMATGVWLRSWKAGAAFAAVGLLWAFGRVYAGVCYPLDVLAGAGIGITIAILSHLWLWTMEPLPTIIFRVAAYFHIASPPPPLEEGRRRAPLYKLLGRFVQ